MRTVRRKSIATRSPSACPLPHLSSSSLTSGGDTASSSVSRVHDLPPGTFGSPSLQSLIYATSNDRFPGAPGTLLHRAKLEAARALAAKQRELQREAERREEMKRLGILGVGKKRATTTANGRFATSPAASDRARRSNVAATAAAAPGAANGSNPPSGSAASGSAGALNAVTSAGASSRPGRANGRNVAANALDPSSLPTPVSAGSSQQGAAPSAQVANGLSSPLLSASGRLRRPATGSRGASPMPLTGVNGTTAATTSGSGGMMTRTRSPIVPALELDDVKDASGGPALISSGQGVVA